jgi:diguanylate cyclase
MELENQFETGGGGNGTTATNSRRTKGSPGRPPKDGASRARISNPYYQELELLRATLAEAAQDRALLLAKIDLLAKKIQGFQNFAHHDELTGLPNRRLLEDHYGLAVARSERQRDNVALLFIDVDGFKRINDAFGHTVADGILQRLSARLIGCIRASDTACRYGGDEFVVLLSDNHGRPAAESTANKIRKRLSEPFKLHSAAIELSVSIGIALFPIDGPELRSLIRAADSDMYREKAGLLRDSRIERERAMEDAAFTNEGAPPKESKSDCHPPERKHP